MSFQLVWNLSEKEGFWTSQNDKSIRLFLKQKVGRVKNFRRTLLSQETRCL
jgi:hypothetical protein